MHLSNFERAAANGDQEEICDRRKGNPKRKCVDEAQREKYSVVNQLTELEDLCPSRTHSAALYQFN